MPSSRAAVLTANLPNHDAMAASYRAEIAARPQEAAELVAEARYYTKWYQTDPRAARLPPMLAREPWEPAGEWINRAYQQGGYRQ